MKRRSTESFPISQTNNTDIFSVYGSNNTMKRRSRGSFLSWILRYRCWRKQLPILIIALVGYRQLTQRISNTVPTKTQSLETTDVLTAKTHTWKDWPAVAYKEIGHSLVIKGDDSFSINAKKHYFTTTDMNKNSNNGKSIKLIDEFLEVYKNRPDKTNLCGIRINHAMALFLSVRLLQPSLVVESGVNAGQSTYFIRAAASNNKTKIFAIDPLDEPICSQKTRWIDDSKLTTYFTGKKDFVDLLDLDWKGMIDKKEVDANNTLVFLDDHLHVYDRIKAMMKHGIRHYVCEDNYKVGEGATRFDKISTPKQLFSDGNNDDVRDFFDNHVKTYAEFPALVPPIVAKESKEPRKPAGGFMVAADKNEDIVHPILRPDLDEHDMALYEEIATVLGYDPSLKDKESYMQFMNYNQIAYLEVSA